MKKTKKLIYLLGTLTVIIACSRNSAVPDSNSDEYQVLEVSSNWFDVSYIDPKTYVIEEPQSSQENVSYLILGDQKAIMFDTGTGENQPQDGSKARHISDQLTNLPLTLSFSHFHFDHNQNIAEFDWIAFPELPVLQQNVSVDSIYIFTSEDLILGNYPAQTRINEWLPINIDIDLGNRIIQLANIQGHTDESIALIDKTNKLAFLGDYLYNGQLYLFSSRDLTQYEESVDHLISILDSDYRLFGAHGTPEIQFIKLQTLKDFLQCIGNSICSPMSTTVEGFPVLVYNFQGMEIVIFQ